MELDIEVPHNHRGEFGVSASPGFETGVDGLHEVLEGAGLR